MASKLAKVVELTTGALMRRKAIHACWTQIRKFTHTEFLFRTAFG